MPQFELERTREALEQAMQDEHGDDDGERLCVVCMENAKCIMLEPCHHVCLCATCAHIIDACPLCRAHCLGRTQLFM